jgi:hypothetical protein
MATAMAPSKVTHEMSELNESGDTRVIWDSENEDEVAAARATFDKLTKNGKFAAFQVKTKGEKGERMRDFDPEAEKIILVPQIAGG